MDKCCSYCKQYKPITDFHKRKAAPDGYQGYCKKCSGYIARVWEKNNPDKALSKQRKYLYKVTEKEIDTLRRQQNGRCAICQQETFLVVDHDHITGKTRGLLCQLCNRGLGNFKDTIKSLQNAIIYLEKS